MNRESDFDSLFAAVTGPGQDLAPARPLAAQRPPWKLLLVDDEADMHAVLRLAVQDIVVEGRALQLIDAHSAAEARACLQAHPDIALILLDVVMETDRAGLDLVRHIRDELGNRSVQILIVTGQPGYAPQRAVITEYEIDGYRLKSELSADKIFVSIYAALRAFDARHQLLRQREELEQLTVALRERKARLRAVIESAPDAIVLANARGLITDVNPGAERLFGYKADEMLGQPLARLMPVQDPGDPHAAPALMARGEWPPLLGRSHEVQAVRRSGEEFPVELVLGTWRSAEGPNYSAILRDIGERRQMEEKIRRLAFYDPLTQLPNRRLLLERLNHTIAVCRRSACHGAVMMLDLDNFKPLNDTHGHDMGDLLLVEASRRMKQCVRNIDTVGRFGGDEFLIALGELAGNSEVSAAQAMQVAEKIRSAISAPYRLELPHADGATIEHTCTASVGVTLVSADSEVPRLFELADRAMYVAKQAGRNAVVFLDSAAEPHGLRVAP